jgi:N-acyl-D-aspartate/D-glutamate deacylase
MDAIYDLVIRGGLVVDGRGGEPRRADVAVKGGLIADVGEVSGKGREEIDAAGLLVTPGFVDLHTHYDGQAIWSQRINPSSAHGVTTVVMGNCGVGFAPCRPADRDLMMATMEGVEDIPGVVMKEGLTWSWETFPEYLDAVAERKRDIDVAAFVPHSAVRVYVMGERGANREPATDEDLEAMGRVIREAVEAGAVGFATTRTAIDRRSDGALVPSYRAEERELAAAARAVKAGGGGVLQILPETDNKITLPIEEEFGLMERLAGESGLPLTFSIAQGKRNPVRYREFLKLAGEAAKKGVQILPQYFPRPIGLLAGFDLTSNPFYYCPTYQTIAHLPLEERIKELRKPEIRAKITSEPPGDELLPLVAMARSFQSTYELGDPPNYEPAPGSSIADRAQAMGVRPEELAYDLLLQRDGRAMLYVAIGNYANESLDHVNEFFDHPNTVMGLGDGGAHYGLVCDSSYPTFVLQHWTRDRTEGRISIGRAIEAMSARPARAIGLSDRGVVAPGFKADLNVIDHARVRLNAPVITDDLPGGGRRLDQTAEGYRWTIVSGEVIAHDGRPTGKLPGRLVRRGQAFAAAAE